MSEIEARSMNQVARIAGLLYLVVVLTGIFSLIYVPSQTFVQGDALATVNNIAASVPLFRLGIASGLICYTVFLLLPFVLYRLLSPVSKSIAILMVALAVVSVPIFFATVLNKLNVLSLLSGANYSRAFTIEQLHAQVMLSLDAYGNGILVSEIFWGLWLFPFGYLVFKSGFLPKVLGVLLMVGCFGYLIDSFGGILFSGYSNSAISNYATLPAGLGEIGTCLWLLIGGVRESKSPAVAAHGNAA